MPLRPLKATQAGKSESIKPLLPVNESFQKLSSDYNQLCSQASYSIRIIYSTGRRFVVGAT